MDEPVKIGMRVDGSDGQAGTISDILLDDKGVPRYLVVQDRGVFSSDVVLPIGGATTDGTSIRYNGMTRQEIHHADRYDAARYGPQAGLYSQTASRYGSDEGQG